MSNTKEAPYQSFDLYVFEISLFCFLKKLHWGWWLKVLSDPAFITSVNLHILGFAGLPTRSPWHYVLGPLVWPPEATFMGTYFLGVPQRVRLGTEFGDMRPGDLLPGIDLGMSKLA